LLQFPPEQEPHESDPLATRDLFDPPEEKADTSLLTSLPPHMSHVMRESPDGDRINLSKRDPQRLQRYSYTGMITSETPF